VSYPEPPRTVPGLRNPFTRRSGGTVKPPLTSAVGDPVTYVQDPGLKVTGTVLVRFSKSPITRSTKLSSSGRAGGSGLHDAGNLVDQSIDFRPDGVCASTARFIKLGPGGAWERLCLDDGTLRLAYYEVPHEMGVAGDVTAIRDLYMGRGLSKAAATSHANQVRDFYQLSADTLWITFANGYMWWCFAESEVTFLGNNRERYPDGSRLRRTDAGWSNTDITGRPLLMSSLNGNVTKIAGYRGAICKAEPLDYLLRRINGEEVPEVVQARSSHEVLLRSIEPLLAMLTWQDFELLVELVFARSGWRRTGRTGGAQKTVDLELEIPITGERAFVQVKSRTTQAQLDDYVEHFQGRPDARMFYVYHSAKSELTCAVEGVVAVGPERLPEMVLEAGLFDWLVDRVS